VPRWRGALASGVKKIQNYLEIIRYVAVAEKGHDSSSLKKKSMKQDIFSKSFYICLCIGSGAFNVMTTYKKNKFILLIPTNVI
jgi:hypothetical protein